MILSREGLEPPVSIKTRDLQSRDIAANRSTLKIIYLNPSKFNGSCSTPFNQ